MTEAAAAQAKPISRLVVDGHHDMRVVFGTDEELVVAPELMARGSELYSDTADNAVVGLVMTNDRPTVEVILGALATGGRVVSLPLPGRGADMGEYAASLRRICEHYELAEVVATDALAMAARDVGALPVRPHSELRTRPLAAPDAGRFELVQFTSGSTGQPRPIALSDEELGANVMAVLAVVRPRPGDVLVSWLPLAHDMGLVGMLLMGLAAGGAQWAGGGEIVLLDPRSFLRRPMAWMEALSRWKGTFTAAPDFAFRMAAERKADSALDLSSLRCAIVGGEIVRAGTLAAFADAYRANSFGDMALCPAYGMAELGVAATLTPPGLHWRELAVQSAGLADNRVLSRRDETSATTLVSSGLPLPGYDLSVSSPDGHIGQLSVRGPSIGVDGTCGAPLAGHDGWYRTGDAGFVDDGWLYVCGRVDDWFATHGRNIYAPAVEAAVGRVGGVRPGRVTAVGLPAGTWVVVAEPVAQLVTEPAGVAHLQREIRRAVVGAAAARPDEVVIVAPGSLPLTSSGKLQRHHVRAQLLNHELADVAAEAAS